MKQLLATIILVFVTAAWVSPQVPLNNVQPQSDGVLMQTGMELMKKNKFTEAQVAFQTLIRLYPGSSLEPAALYALGESFQSQAGKENLWSAEDQFRNFISFFPQNPKAPDAQMKIISILMRQLESNPQAREAKRALLEINKFLTLYPTNDSVPIAAQYRHELVRNLREMAVPISGHIQDSGGKPIPNVKVTILYRITKVVVSTTYSDVEGNFEISASGLTKEISEFGLQFEKEGFQLLQLDGEDMYAKSSKLILYSLAEEHTAIGDYFFSAGNDIAAIGRYEEAIRLQPDLRAANDGLGRSLERMGKYEQAVAAYQNFITRFPESPAVSEFKARILKIQNKK